MTECRTALTLDFKFPGLLDCCMARGKPNSASPRTSLSIQLSSIVRPKGLSKVPWTAAQILFEILCELGGVVIAYLPGD